MICWIGENLQEALGFPDKNDLRAGPGSGWSAAELNHILQAHVVDGTLITFGTGSGMYWYILVHTSTYGYVLVCTVYNGIYYHVYLWVHAMNLKAPLGHLERVASGTHYATKLF